MTKYTTDRINFEIDRLQETLDLLMKDLITYPPNQNLCIILFSTITALKDAVEFEASIDSITDRYKGETLPFSILETA